MKPISLHILLIPFLIFSTTTSHINPQNPYSPPPSPPQDLLITFLDQKLALVYPIIQAFKSTITTDPLNITDTWVGADVCSYKGFYCDHPPDNLSATAIAAIDFNGFRLAAPTLEGFVDELPDLALFHANSNRFSGTISSVSRLKYLYELDISNNDFSGEFPAALLEAPFLSFLDVRFNSFSGSLPPELFVRALDALFVNDNNFVQTLPVNLGATTATYLTLANNKLTGTIPRSIGNASSTLTEVLFLNNALTGCLPYEIGHLRSATVFDAGRNSLTGPLPCSVACMDKAEQLVFAGNMLYGAVPELACRRLGNLVNFSLSENYFTKVGPHCRKLIRSGVLDVSRNCILGLSEQRSLKECALFFLRPRICPYPTSSFSIVPCRASAAPATGRPRWNLSRRAPVSYAALSSRHKL